MSLRHFGDVISYFCRFVELLTQHIISCKEHQINPLLDYVEVLGVQFCFRCFPINGFSGKWWSK